MRKSLFNYFFFVWVLVLPITIATISIPLFWPLIDNPYGNIILSPLWTMVGMYIFGFLFFGGIAAYMALPWLVVIKNDRVVFHRLFRRKLGINLSEVKKVEVISKKLPVKDYRWGIGSVSFKMKDGDEWLVSGIGHSIIIAIYEELKQREIDWYELNRKLTDKEKINLQKRGY